MCCWKYSYPTNTFLSIPSLCHIGLWKGLGNFPTQCNVNVISSNIWRYTYLVFDHNLIFKLLQHLTYKTNWQSSPKTIRYYLLMLWDWNVNLAERKKNNSDCRTIIMIWNFLFVQYDLRIWHLCLCMMDGSCRKWVDSMTEEFHSSSASCFP